MELEKEEEEAPLVHKKQLSFELRGLTGYFEARIIQTILGSSFGKTRLSSLECLFILSNSSDK